MLAYFVVRSAERVSATKGRPFFKSLTDELTRATCPVAAGCLPFQTRLLSSDHPSPTATTAGRSGSVDIWRAENNSRDESGSNRVMRCERHLLEKGRYGEQPIYL